MHRTILILLFFCAIITISLTIITVSATYDVNSSKTEEDVIFLQTMNQVWIPDIYSVSGKMDLAICSNGAYPGLFNATIADVKVTLMADTKEMMHYNLTSFTTSVRTDYQNITFSTFRILNQISHLDHELPGFEDNATVLVDIIPVYANWMSYRTMYWYKVSDVKVPDYATFPSEQIISVMENLADTVTKSAGRED